MKIIPKEEVQQIEQLRHNYSIAVSAFLEKAVENNLEAQTAISVYLELYNAIIIAAKELNISFDAEKMLVSYRNRKKHEKKHNKTN